MEKVGGRIIIAGAHGRVEEVLLLTHLHRIINLYPDLAAACAALTDPATPPATA
jgi:anti-anti-sigma regulatory factor